MKTVPTLASDEIQEDKPMPSRNHARAAHNLSVLLDRFTEGTLRDETVGIEIPLSGVFA